MKRPLYVTLGYYFSSALVIGMGLSLGVVLTSIPLGEITENRERLANALAYYDYVPGHSGLSIVNTKEINGNCSTDIIGTLSNISENAWDNPVIHAEFYNSEGVFVDMCRYVHEGILLPGNNLNFKMECGSCENRSVPEHSRYDVKVVTAIYVDKERWERELNNLNQNSEMGRTP